MKEIYRVALLVNGAPQNVSVTAQTQGGAERRALKLAKAYGATVELVSAEVVHYEQLALSGGGDR